MSRGAHNWPGLAALLLAATLALGPGAPGAQEEEETAGESVEVIVAPPEEPVSEEDAAPEEASPEESAVRPAPPPGGPGRRPEEPLPPPEERRQRPVPPPQGPAPPPGETPVALEGGEAPPQMAEPAGNVADAELPPGERQPPLEAEPPDSFFTEEEMRELAFPEFADEQPGFIPDIPPTDLFAERPSAPTFETLLGPSRLPAGEVDEMIGGHARAPGRDLEENYARVVVPDGTIEGSTETKQFHIEGGLIIYYSDVTITGETADIDEKNEIAVLYGDVNIVDPKYSLKTEELRIAFEDKQFQATGFVQFKKVSDPEKEEPDLSLPKKDRLREYFAGQQFELFCRELFYDWEAKQLTAIDSVRLVHPSFNGALDRLDYNDETKEYEMSGSVDLEVTDYDWIFANELVEREDEQRVRALAEGSTLVKCDRLRYAEETGIAEFYATPGGEVLFKQQTRDVRAAYAEVNDETKDFYAEGAEGRQVRYHQTDGSWLFDGGLVDRAEVSEELTEALEQELAVDADTLAYNFDRKRLELSGNVVVKSSKRSITAAEVVQDETAKFFLLRGNVKIQPDENSTVQAAQVYLDTENDVITFVGLVQGQMRSEDIPTTEEMAEEGEYTPAAGLFQQPGTRQSSATGNANIAEGREG